MMVQENAVPTDNQWFDLEVDDDVGLMEVVASGGYDPKDWKYLGPQFKGRNTYRAKLVRFGRVHNLAEARDKAKKIGCRLCEGQAREPFKNKFPKSDGKGRRIAFGGSEWEFLFGKALIAFLDGVEVEWSSDFRSSDDAFSESWRWVVVDNP